MSKLSDGRGAAFRVRAASGGATLGGAPGDHPCGMLAEPSTRVGPRATENREPRQDRKGATVSGHSRVPQVTWPSSRSDFRRNVEDLTASVLAGIGSALVVLGGYHFFVARPRLRRFESTLGTHDGLLGGGGAEPATQRVSALEAAAATAGRE